MGVFTETIALKDDVTSAAKKASGAVDDLASKTSGLTESLGELGAASGGIALVAAAAVAAVAGLGALVYAGASFAVSASEAKNASLSLWSALGEGKVTGAEIDDMLDDMRAKTGLTKDSLAAFTTEFLKMGITGKESLEDLTTAAASAEAIVKGGGDAFTKMYRNIDAAAEAGQKLTIPLKKLSNQLASMGLNVEDVGKAMGVTGAELTSQLKAGTVDARKFGEALQVAVTEKGAGPMATLANSSANLGKILEEYLGDLFEDLGESIAPFMAAVKDLFGILESKSNPSGQALKAGIGGFFKQVFAVATKVVPYIKHFLLDVIIYGLKAYIALMPIVKAIKEFANSASGASIISKVLSAIYTVAVTLAIGVGLVIAAFAIVWAIATGLAITLWALVGAFISLMVDGIQAQIAAWSNLGASISAFVSGAIATLTGWVTGATQAATDFVAGLVAGITAGASQVVAAVSGLASSATGAFKSALGIKSPSKVMMALGDHTGTGFAMGLEDTGPDVHAAASGVSTAAVQGAQAPGAPPAAAGGGASNQYNVTVNLTADSKSAEGITREMVAATFEAFALGAGV